MPYFVPDTPAARADLAAQYTTIGRMDQGGFQEPGRRCAAACTPSWTRGLKSWQQGRVPCSLWGTGQSSCLLQRLVAPGVPWLVAAPFQSLPWPHIASCILAVSLLIRTLVVGSRAHLDDHLKIRDGDICKVPLTK